MRKIKITMLYFIGYLLSGEAKKKHKYLTNKIADEFEIFRLNGYIPPHISLKRPFEANVEQKEELEILLTRFSQSHKKTDLKLKNFGSFRKDVIFVDVIASQTLMNMINELEASLKIIPWMTFDEYEQERKLHATLAYKDENISKKFDEIWKFVSKESFNFEVEFDNITLFKKTDIWSVDKQFLLCEF